MNGPLQTISYESIDEDLKAALSWLDNLGIDYNKTRIRTYEKDIESLINIYNTKNIEAARREFPKICNSLYEVSEFIVLYKGLANKFDDQVADRIQEFCKGTVSYAEENPDSSNRARNVAFELLIASLLKSRGIELDFRDDVDVACIFENYTILFECKRPQSSAKIKKNVKTAFKQLSKHCAKFQSKCKGIIAVDISKICNPKFQLFVFENKTAINNGLSKMIDNFITNRKSFWQINKYKNTIGVLIRFSLLAVNEQEKLITYCQQYGFNTRVDSGYKNTLLAKQIANRISNVK